MLFVVDVLIYNAATTAFNITHSYVCVNCSSEFVMDLIENCVSLHVHINSLNDY